jgi:lipocalin
MKKQLNLLIVSLVLLCSCKGQEPVIDNSVVKDLNIDRYLGKWYEIARFDHSFERGLVGVTAEYSMREDGKIKVVNSGYKGSLDGEKSEAIGKAKIPNSSMPSKLKVSFFWIFYGDYFVLELDENYQWAIVGSKTDKYLWILSRNPQMDDQLYSKLLNKLQARGYNTSKLIKVVQRKE